MKRRILWAFAAALLVLAAVYWELIVYGVRQGAGQWRIVREARPIEEFIADPGFPDSLKRKLRLVQQVRRFAVDSLGLTDTDNYRTMFDQRGEEIMWVVTACRPYAMEPRVWEFPVVGSLPYKGYFRRDLAVTLYKELEGEGWDVWLRNPGGWSTLGWFRDPILSGMLKKSDGELAEVIIHEMVHSTLFVKDSVEFNENLATFIGERGAEQFLKHLKDSATRTAYVNFLHDDHRYSLHFLAGARRLDSLYKSMSPTLPTDEKDTLKVTTIRGIVRDLDTVSFRGWERPSRRFSRVLPNNAYFMNFIHYQSRQSGFEEEFNRVFGRDVKRFVEHYRRLYPSV
jgi:predicted aminopeptidase